MCCCGTVCKCMSLSAAVGHVCCKQIYKAGSGNTEEKDDDKGEHRLEKRQRGLELKKQQIDHRPPTHPLQYATIATAEWAKDGNLYMYVTVHLVYNFSPPPNQRAFKQHTSDVVE